MFRDFLFDYLEEAAGTKADDKELELIGEVGKFNSDLIKDKQLPQAPLSTQMALLVALGIAVVLSLILYAMHMRKKQKDPSANDKGMGALYLAVFLDSLGAFAVLPFMGPLIVLFGCDAFQATLLSGAFAFCQFIGSPVIGYLGDKIDRRIILLWTLGVCGATLGLGGLTMELPRRFPDDSGGGLFLKHDPNDKADKDAPGLNIAYWTLLVLRMTSGFFASTVGVIQTMVAEISPEDQMAANLATVMGIFCLGLVGGPLIGGLFYNWGLQTLFFTSGAITMVNVGYAYLSLDTTAFQKKKPAEDPKTGEVQEGSPFKEAMKSMFQHPFTMALLVAAFFATGSQSMFMQAAGLFNLQIYGWGGLQVGIIFGLGGFLFAFASVKVTPILLPALGGECKAVVVGGLLRFATQTTYALVRNYWTPWILCPIQVLEGICIDAPLQTLLAKYAPKSSMGTLFGFMQMMRSLGEALAPPLGGYLADKDLIYPLYTTNFMALACALLMVPFLSTERAAQQKEKEEKEKEEAAAAESKK